MVNKSALHRGSIRDFQVVRGTGLTIGIASGVYNISGVIGTFNGASNVPVADNATNYIMLDSAGVVTVNTTGFVTGLLALATVTTSSGVIPIGGVSDMRVIVGNHGAGLGTGVWRRGPITGTINGVNDVFTLPTVPDANSLAIMLDGNDLNVGGTEDFTLSGNTVTFTIPPMTGSKIIYAYTESTPQSPSPAIFLKTLNGTIDVSTSNPASGYILVANGSSTATWKENIPGKIATATGNVSVGASADPTVGQVLTAISATDAEWKTLPPRGIYTYETGNVWVASSSPVVMPTPPTVLDPTADMFKVVFNLKNNNGSSSLEVGLRVNNISSSSYDYTYTDMAAPGMSFIDTGATEFTIASIPGGARMFGELFVSQKDNYSDVGIHGMIGTSNIVVGTQIKTGRINIGADPTVDFLEVLVNQSVTGEVFVYKLI